MSHVHFAQWRGADPRSPASLTKLMTLLLVPDDLKAVDPSATPATTPAPAAKPKVVPTSQKLTVDGKEQNAEICNIGGSNYFKLRDLGTALGCRSRQRDQDHDRKEPLRQPSGL